MNRRTLPRNHRRPATAAALAFALFAGIVAPLTALADRLVSAGSDEQDWTLTAPVKTSTGPRLHLRIDVPRGPPLQLPIVVEPGTNYFAELRTIIGTHADPDAPTRPWIGPERRLTLAVGPRRDYVPDTQQRDKVHLTFVDKDRRGEMLVDVLRPEPRFIAFDVNFDPRYELPRDGHFLIHFQAGQLGMHRGVLPGSGAPPFSIRVRGTSRRQPDPMAPIDLMFLRRWYRHGMPAVQQEWLPDRLDALQRGRWYRIVMRLEPGPVHGHIRLWAADLSRHYDRCDRWLHDWPVAWGYEPPISGDPETDELRRAMSYGVGIYRKAHERTQRLHLRNLRYGTHYDDVAPGRACG